jgi:hypothetical protein
MVALNYEKGIVLPVLLNTDAVKIIRTIVTDAF